MLRDFFFYVFKVHIFRRPQEFDEISKKKSNCLVNSKKVLRLCQIFVVFSEYMNFNSQCENFGCLYLRLSDKIKSG